MTGRSFPKRIALATDLSHRCDRALDRAVLIAKAWKAGLLVVHAVAETEAEGKAPDQVQLVRDRLRLDLLREGEEVELSVHVAAGRPAPIVLEAAAEADAGLIVTGIARDGFLERIFLGDTVDRLIRSSPVPILIVRARAFAPYRRMLVGTDFSPSSRIALETAVRFFPDAALTLCHGYDVPLGGLMVRAEVERQFEGYGQDAADAFLLDAGLSAEAAGKVVRRIERADPEALLREEALADRRALTVVGTHGGGLVYEALVGSTARKIIDAVPGDVLLVPDRARRKPD